MIKQEQLKSIVKDGEAVMCAAAGWTSVGKAVVAQLPSHSHHPEQRHVGGEKLMLGCSSQVKNTHVSSCEPSGLIFL